MEGVAGPSLGGGSGAGGVGGVGGDSAVEWVGGKYRMVGNLSCTLHSY